MDRKHDNIALINLSNYVKPEIKETYGTDWVLNGEKNQFFQYVIDRYNGSPTNESIINVYCELIYGKGLAINGTDEVYSELVDIFPKREQRKCIKDYKLQGFYAMQILRAKGGGVAKILHMPIEKLAPEKADAKGVINNYYHSDDWTNIHKYKPTKIKAFNGKLTDSRMIKVVKPYAPNLFYFSLPNYMAGLQYAELEEEISNYSINHIKNGLSFGYVINFNNGGSISDEQKNKIEAKIREKLTGSENAGKFILSFNDGKDAEVTIVPLEVNDAHSQFEFLSSESMTKLLTAHGVTSPLLFGLSSAGGFGSNADELNTASKLLQDYQISPMQSFFIDELATLLELNGLETDLEFIPLRDSYVDDEEKEVKDETVDTEEKEEVEEAEVEMSEHCDNCGAPSELADELISLGEELDSEKYVLLTESEVDYESDDLIYELIQFASTGTARPNAKSEQDSEDIIIRYRYAGNKAPQREFCKKMMFANKLYRKEDIQQMANKPVNSGFGLGGSNTYDIWLWKGGGKISTKYPNGTCRHKWHREIYLKVDGEVDVNSPLAKRISVAEAKRKGYDIPKNDARVGMTPNPKGWNEIKE